jgi:hypothetical protein
MAHRLPGGFRRAARRQIAFVLGVLWLWGAATVAGSAAAQQANPPAPPSPAAPTSAQPSIEDRLRELERQNRKLAEEVARLKADHEFTKTRLDQVMPVVGKVSGYVDFGFFYVQGDGSGIRADTDHEHFPEYSAVSGTWVLMGDPLSTAINARGEPADTGVSRAVTFDPVNNGGKPSFIVNALNVALFAGVGDDLTVNGMFDLVPRNRDVSDPDGKFLGDFVDVKLAYAEYSLIPGILSLTAGKFDSVLGREYRTQESPDRLTVAPSLICRYTCGHPLGVKARLRLFDETLILNTAVTNGSSFVEMFPFYDEIDVNASKTVSSRLSYRIPGAAHFELGTSGAYGAQDLQTSDSVHQWHYGFDAHLDWRDIEMNAEFVQGHALGRTEPGQLPCNAAPCLTYRGAYAQIGYRVNNWLIPYTRWDIRDALHQKGGDFVYISQLTRVTAGVRLELGTNVIIKADYTVNQELGRIPKIDNDVLTSAFVVKY